MEDSTHVSLYQVTEHIDNFSKNDLLYLQYVVNDQLQDPNKRNYQQLKEFLSHQPLQYQKQIYPFLDKISLKSSTIDTIIDLGGGHTGYYKLFTKYYTNINYIIVDKSPILQDPSDKVTIIMTDVFDYVNTVIVSPKHTLFFMSEFLHCKTSNLNILESSIIKHSHVLINEQMPYLNKSINKRLQRTGGKLVDSYEIELSRKSYIHCYMYYVPFYMLYLPAPV